jgi:energy-coupling factor transporter transmembrane protein EcfT
MFQYNNQTIFSGASESIKIFFMLAVSLAAFTITFIPAQALLILFLLGLLWAAGYRPKNYVKLIVGLLPFMIVLNLAFLIFVAPYRANIIEAITIIDLRIFLIFFNFAFFSLTTDLIAVVKLMKKLRFPESIYLATYIVLRFLPELERDFQQVKDLQRLKGITWRKPALFLQSLFLPLIYLVFERSDEVAVAYYLRERKLKQNA